MEVRNHNELTHFWTHPCIIYRILDMLFFLQQILWKSYLTSQGIPQVLAFETQLQFTIQIYDEGGSAYFFV